MPKHKGQGSSEELFAEWPAYEQAIEHQRVQRELEAGLETLEFNDYHRLVPEQEAQRRRERLAAVPDTLRKIPKPLGGGIEGQPDPVQMKGRRCGWKDRHIRQKGARQLRQIANAQNDETYLEFRNEEVREAQPLEIDRKAHEAAAREAPLLKAQRRETRRRADEEMDRISRETREAMLRDTEERDGKKSGIRMLQEIDGLKTVDTGEAYQLIEDYRNLGIRDSSFPPYEDLAAKVEQVRQMGRELQFRMLYVLPAYQNAGRQRPDLIDSVARMNRKLKDEKRELQNMMERFVEEARAFFEKRNEERPGGEQEPDAG